MKSIIPLLTFICFFFFDLSAQGHSLNRIQDKRVTLANNSGEINSLLDELSSLYGISNNERSNIENFITSCFERMPSSPLLEESNIRYLIEIKGQVGVQIVTPNPSVSVWFCHYNLERDSTSHRNYFETDFQYIYSAFRNDELNIVAAVVFDQSTLTRPERISFIITDMDKL